MKYNPDIHHRKSIRLKNYDYSKEGLYFITISIQNKLCLFGEIKNNENILFESGKMIEKNWLELENKYDTIKLHEFIVMPNHFHGIIEIIKNEGNIGNLGQAQGIAPTNKNYEIINIKNNVGEIPCGCPYDNNKNYEIINTKNNVGAIPCGCPYDNNKNYEIINIKNNVGEIPCGCPYDNNKNYEIINTKNNVGAIPCGCPNDNNKNYEIINIKNNVGAIPCGCSNDNNKNYKNTIGNIIGGFKSLTTNEYIKLVKNNISKPFNKKLWQRNYYENIIRNEESYLKISEYIKNNPLKWIEDKFYYTEI